MSKAFTREDDAQVQPVTRPRDLGLPAGAKNYMTEDGARRLRDELAVTSDPERQRFLRDHLDTAEIVGAPQDTSRVLFGAWVTYRTEDGRETRVRIVGVAEADPRRGLVSWLSPLARALLGQRPGDTIPFRSPRGDEDLELLSVSYEGTGSPLSSR